MTVDRVAQCLAYIEVEWITELILLRVVGAFMARTTEFDLVFALTVVEQSFEQIAKRVLADLANGFRCQLIATISLFDQASFFKLLGELLQFGERRGRVVAQQVAELIRIDLCELARVCGVAHHVFECVEIADLVEHRTH